MLPRLFLPRLFALIVALALPSLALADDFYVDGRNGADLPENGRSVQTPWKTIAYALGRIPAPVAPAGHTLHIAGAQTYAATTNGESFPLDVRPAVALVGEGTAPVLLPPQAYALRFSATLAFGADTCLVNLDVRGWPVTVGGLGTEHSPTFSSCRFEGSGIAVYAYDNARDAPRIEACSFAGGDQGVEVRVAGQCTNAYVAPRVIDCVFMGQRVAGVYVDHGHDSPQQTRVDVRVEQCRFVGGARGVMYFVETLGAGSRSEVAVIDCSFQAVTQHGVLCQTGLGGYFDSLTVEGCRFFAGDPMAEGIAVDGPGAAAILRRNVIVGGTSGVVIKAFPLNGGYLARARLEDLLIVGCADGVAVGPSARPALIDLARSRLLRNGVGVRVYGSSPAVATVNLESSLIAGGNDGLWLDTPHIVVGNGLTIADHVAAGVRATHAGTGSALLHCVIADNTTELVGTMAASYCAFRNQTVAGTGNLRVDPLLLRPAYKLLPDSPCIDAGNAAQPLPATDYEGDPRIVAGRGGTQPDIGADEFVPEGSVRFHGLPGLGAGGVLPRIASPNRSARLGEPVDVQVRDARNAAGAVAAAAALFLGIEEVAFDLGAIGAPGSALWTMPLWALAPIVPDATGIGAVRLVLPTDPGLYGASFQLQWVVVQPPTAPIGLVTSDALRLSVGR